MSLPYCARALEERAQRRFDGGQGARFPRASSSPSAEAFSKPL